MAVKIDSSKWNQSISTYTQTLDRDIHKEMPRQVAKLMETLVKFTPPENLAKTRAQIRSRLEHTFTVMNKRQKTGEGGDIEWLFSNKDFLVGTSDAFDYRTSSQEQVDQVANSVRLGKKKSIVYPFKHPRKKQMVKIYTRFVITRTQLNNTWKRIVANIGKLKAGWIIGQLRTGESIDAPDYVQRNVSKTRGTYVDNLGVPGAPSFTIVNAAAGVGKLGRIVNNALNVRAKAMLSEMKNILIHSKKTAGFA